MRKYYLQTVLALLLLALCSCQENKIAVCLLVDGDRQPSEEIDSLKSIIESGRTDVECQILSIDQLDDLNRFDVVWYHRRDTTELSAAETAAADPIKKYLDRGGKLIVSMEAVRLLNAWHIESNPIETRHKQLIDDGYGRAVGFHGYREHPLFDGMFGGAYTWHGKTDNVCRVSGFFDGKRPKAMGARVAAILWEYIFYRPDQCVLWETPVGKGNILAAGGFLYYSEANFNAALLKKFTDNCIDYMAGRKMKSRALYWDIRPHDIKEQVVEERSIEMPVPHQWNLATNADTLVWQAGSASVDMASQRMMIAAREKGGIEEIWSHPFMALRDLRIWLDVPQCDTLICLNDLQPIVELRANTYVRRYRVGDLELQEVIAMSVDNPVAVDHLQWQGGSVNRVITDYKSNLRYMWPYDYDALAPICYGRCNGLNSMAVYDANKEYVSFMGANIEGQTLYAGQADRITYPYKQPLAVATDLLQVAFSIAYNTNSVGALDIFTVAGNTGWDDVAEQYALVAGRDAEEILVSSSIYYADYLKNHLSIVTPDTLFNEGLRWATASTAQFIANTPGIGTSLMAGYASSRRGWGGNQSVSGRPGYAWYFGRDAAWSAMAFVDLGNFATVRNVLETMIAYQQIDGKIYHELSSSGSVHYDASDATPLFVNLMARYLRASGDREFVVQHIGAINKAMDFCFSTDTDGDGLIEITNVGHGWLEGGELFGSQTEFYLCGLWNAALNDAACLNRAAGLDDMANKYSQQAAVVNGVLNDGFWNPKGYYNYGKKADGTYTDQCIALVAVPIYMGVTDSCRSVETVRRFASCRYSADWGVRMIDDSHSVFNPSAYHFGSVWPLFTGWVSLAEYSTGRFNQGFEHIMATLLNYCGVTHGRVPEVINGLVYKSSGVTTHQCWSETMAIHPSIEGLLGYRPDALANTLALSPNIPFNWAFLSATNIPLGSNRIALDMKRSYGKSVWKISAIEEVKLHFSPTFAPATVINEVLVNGKPIHFECVDSKEYVRLELETSVDTIAEIEVLYNEGISTLPCYTVLRNGAPSLGAKVIEQHYADGHLHAVVEGLADSEGEIKLYLPDGFEQATGIESIDQLADGSYSAKVKFSKSLDKYVSKTIDISSKISNDK